MTTQTHLDIFTRLAMMLILLALGLYGYSYAGDIAANISRHLNQAVSATTPPRR